MGLSCFLNLCFSFMFHCIYLLYIDAEDRKLCCGGVFGYEIIVFCNELVTISYDSVAEFEQIVIVS